MGKKIFLRELMQLEEAFSRAGNIKGHVEEVERGTPSKEGK